MEQTGRTNTVNPSEEIPEQGGDDLATSENKNSYSKDEMDAYVEQKLNEELERVAAEKKLKESMSMDDRERELANRESDIARREQKEQIYDIFSKQRIPKEFFELVDASSETAIEKSIANINTLVNSVQREYLIGYTPKSSDTNKSEADGFTRAFTSNHDKPTKDR